MEKYVNTEFWGIRMGNLRRKRLYSGRHAILGKQIGLATVEVALTLPILLLITLATIDTCHVIFVRQSAKIAAYECARMAIIPGIKREQLDRQCAAILESRNIKDFELSMSVEDPALFMKGDLLQVEVTVPADSNSLGISWFYQGRVFEETVSILVEQSGS